MADRPAIRANVRDVAIHNGDGTVDLRAVAADGQGVVVTFTAWEYLTFVERGVSGAIQQLKDRIEVEKRRANV